ncbi:MAG: hypothetical protein ACPGNT_04410 [Rhodospirillales bacterium]
MLHGYSSSKPQAEDLDDMVEHLVKTFGIEGARDVCRNNHWRGIQRKLEASESQHRLSIATV